MTKIEILQVGPYPEWDEGPLNDTYHVHRFFEAKDKDAFLRDVGGEIRGVACRGESVVSRSMIDRMPKLEMISVYGVGYDGVDLEACRERGVRITNTPRILAKDVADLAVAMLLALGRGLVPADGWVRSRSWKNVGPFPLQRRIHGLRAGILGLGQIGHEVARRLHGFDMPVSYFSRMRKDTDWEYVEDPVTLASRVDVLFVTLAASAQTRHIVDEKVLAALGPEGLLVNVSRAANVDEAALLNALESKGIAGAGLDVFNDEPDVNPRFLALPNVVLQPHQGSATLETRKAMGQLMRDNLDAHFSGRPLLTPIL
ncbi:MAG TPA: 2-hydroxyacid dehydrogenase [Devosia sp.]|nr:2-hydroxyacid dehydrogenase [Devosia sp.]